MDSEVVKRLKAGIAANGFAQAVTLLNQVMLVPFYFKFWGKDLYGEWLLLFTLPAFLTISDLSFGTAAGNQMTVLVANGKKEEAVGVFQTGWAFATIVSAILLVTFGLILTIAPLPMLSKLSILGQYEARAVLMWLVAYVAVSLQGTQLESAYRCDGRYPRGITNMNFMRLAESVATAVVLVAGGHPVHVASTLVFVRIVAYALMFLDIHRLMAWLRLGWREARFELAKPLIVPALSFMLFPVSMALSIQGMIMVVGMLGTPALVALFNTHRTLSRVVWQLTNMFAQASLPEFSRAIGSRNLPLGREIHARMSRTSLWLSIGAIALALLLGPPIYQLLTHKEVSFFMPLFGLLLAVAIPGAVLGCSTVALQSVNKHQIVSVVTLIVTTLGVGLAIGLGKFIGPLYGSAVAIVATESILAVIVLRMAMQLLGGSATEYIGRTFRIPRFVRDQET